MNLFGDIKNDMNIARKNGDKNTVIKLSTLVGEIQAKAMSKGSELTDQEVLSIIKKFVSNIDETIKALVGKDISSFQEERGLYSKYLPQEMSAQDIEDFFNDYASRYTVAMGIMMVALKRHAEEKGVIYNGKIASEIAKKLIA